MSINWFPGHMVRARREIEENLKLVDIVLVLLDARAPFSCRNQMLENMLARKTCIYILNKSDLADKNRTANSLKQLNTLNRKALPLDSLSGEGLNLIIKSIKSVYAEKAQISLDKGRRLRAPRLMVVGVPNIGKSTFLNRLVGKKTAATGPRPGVTKGKQWVRIREDMDVLDTPGIMWPKIESIEQGFKLALLDIVGENAYDNYEVALYLITFLKKTYPHVLSSRYKINDQDLSVELTLEEIAAKRGYINAGGIADIDKAAVILLQEFRTGKLGRVSLE